jgi:uncharacterized protein (TIGR04255 family)
MVEAVRVIQLPAYEQVLLGESPLQEVVCQLRFHPILKIAIAPPADFQDLIRKDFPVVGQESGAQISVVGGKPIISATNESAWQFKSANEASVVSLTSSFVALKTSQYSDFRTFNEQLLSVIRAFERAHEPPFYVRVGLRYVNRWIIPRDGDMPVAWADLLNKYLAGLFADPMLRDGIVEAKHHLVLQTEHGQVGCRYSRDVGDLDGKAAEQFTLDFDHYVTGQIEPKKVQSLLVGSNDTVYRLFRWCLTEKGFEVLRGEAGSRRERSS